jgi:hypothetical protein
MHRGTRTSGPAGPVDDDQERRNAEYERERFNGITQALRTPNLLPDETGAMIVSYSPVKLAGAAMHVDELSV